MWKRAWDRDDDVGDDWNVPLICWRRNLPQVPIFFLGHIGAYGRRKGVGRIGSGWLTLMNVSRLSKLNGKLTQLQQGGGRRRGRSRLWHVVVLQQAESEVKTVTKT